MGNLWSVIIGAAIASIVPIVTLFLNDSRWKKEKLVEHLRLKHERLERVYAEVNEALPQALKDNLYPSSITTKIFTYGSDEVNKVFSEYVKSKDKTAESKKIFVFDMAKEAHNHLISIDKQIEDILS